MTDRYTISRTSAFWVSAGVVCHTLWTSAAPAVTYPLYAHNWHLSFIETTAVFSIYPLVVVGVLIGLGDLSDHIGRRKTMLIGLTASLIGVLLMAVASNVDWLFAGRIFMGVGVGLSASPSTAAVLEFSRPDQQERAGFVTAAAQALGFGSATLIGGGLIQYAPYPTRLNFWVLFIFISLLLVGTWFMPRTFASHTKEKWRFRLPYVPAGTRLRFAAAAAAGAAGYTIGSLILSLGAQTARDLVGSQNALVNGGAITLFAVFSGACGLYTKRLEGSKAVFRGAAVAILSMALLAASTFAHSLPVFLLAISLSGVAYSFMFMGGLNLITRDTPDEHRAASLSAFYLAAYFAQGAVAFGLGLIANFEGLRLAMDVGAAAVGAIGLAAIIFVWVGRHVGSKASK
jgi:MFS family permease